MLTLLFDGIAYGMLMFVLAVGLAVTLGLMNFVNLAHGAFAMTGGYVCAVLVNNSGWPFFAALPLAFVVSALIGVALERSLYRHLYTRSHLDQVLFSIGLTFMSVASVDYIMGSSRIFIKLPSALEGQFDFLVDIAPEPCRDSKHRGRSVAGEQVAGIAHEHLGAQMRWFLPRKRFEVMFVRSANLPHLKHDIMDSARGVEMMVPDAFLT